MSISSLKSIHSKMKMDFQEQLFMEDRAKCKWTQLTKVKLMQFKQSKILCTISLHNSKSSAQSSLSTRVSWLVSIKMLKKLFMISNQLKMSFVKYMKTHLATERLFWKSFSFFSYLWHFIYYLYCDEFTKQT